MKLILKLHLSRKLKRKFMTISTVGYSGSGPAQLALAVFLEVPVSEGTAFAYYHAFEFQIHCCHNQLDDRLEDRRRGNHRVASGAGIVSMTELKVTYWRFCWVQ